MRFADVICKLGEKIRHVYFPTESFISLVTALDDGPRLEVGIVGDEGMLGTSLILGVNRSPQHALVQGAGACVADERDDFMRHYQQDAELRQQLSRYRVRVDAAARANGCLHQLSPGRGASCPLAADESRPCSSRSVYLTHEFLAYMLGVRRVGVTHAASSLQEQGLIDYSRGAITILDNARLEKASCACYRERKCDVRADTRCAARGKASLSYACASRTDRQCDRRT